jgi:hypothetical protein
MLMLLTLAGRAEAQNYPEFREAWLQWWDSNAEEKHWVEMWATGVNQTLGLVVLAMGCKSAPISADTLAAATADLLHQHNEMTPLSAAVIAWNKLSGCPDLIAKAKRAR